MVPTLVTTALSLALGALHPAAGEAPAVPAVDACAPAALPPADPACRGDGPLCSARERVALACQARDAMERRYVFWPVKGRLLGGGFDPARQLDAWIEAERAIPRERDPLAFYDRARRVTASFHDGHLRVFVPRRLPAVALGVGLRLVDGKVYVANRRDALLDGVRIPDLDGALAVGNEVVAFDGEPAERRVAELAAFVPASSDAARLDHAVDALTLRDFDYPERRTAVLTVRTKDGLRDVELPWRTAPGAAIEPATRAWARRTGIPAAPGFAWSEDPIRPHPRATPARGALRSDTVLARADEAKLTVLTDDDGLLAGRAGAFTTGDGRKACYLQLLTFQTETLDDGSGRRPLATEVERLVRRCDGEGRDLVLDLRQNEGGFLDPTTAIADLLAGPGDDANGALVLRVTDMNQRVYAARAPAGSPAAEASGPLAPARILAALGAARRAGSDYTPAFVEAPGAPEKAFHGRVVALTSPMCMSACDRLSGLLRGSGRAVLVGEPTEGAGGSQQEADGLSTRWTDPQRLLTLAIPNAAMGVARAAGKPAGEVAAKAFFEALAIENHPVKPDVPYAPAVVDLVHHGRGWRAQIDRVLGESMTAHATPAAAPAPASPSPAPAGAPAPAAKPTSSAPATAATTSGRAAG